MSCTKDDITLKKFGGFFIETDPLSDYQVIKTNGTPVSGMDLFLRRAEEKVKGVYLKEKVMSLFYVPIVKDEIVRHFTNEAHQEMAFVEISEEPDTFLIQIRLNHQLFLFKEEEVPQPVILSSLLRYFLKENKTIDMLKADLEHLLQSVAIDDKYKELGGTISLQEESLLEKRDILYIYKRYLKWEYLTDNIHQLLKTYLDETLFHEREVLRFVQNTDYVKLTYNEQMGVNSFYLEDLERIKMEVQEQHYGQGFANYLDMPGWEHLDKSTEKVDFFHDDSVATIKHILKQMPVCRWPSKFPLGLMQQVALNQILHKSKTEDGFVFSVNGPPGTGKTTLLKDVFANILFDKVSYLRKSSSVFTKKKYGEQQSDHYYIVDSALSQFRILITSNNNDAVENLSKDLPRDEVLFKNGYRFLGFDEEAKVWGNISSALGKRKNIERFFEHLDRQLEQLDHHLPASTDISDLEKQIKENVRTMVVDDQFHSVDDEEWQKSTKQYVNIDGDELLHCQRSQLFHATMDEYVAFLNRNQKELKQNLKLAKSYFLNRKSVEHPQFVHSMFETIFLLSPIVSSTFAAIKTFLKEVGQEEIGWLFIDEAGQATPQSAIGAIWRAKNTIVVGDPLQVPPVVTLSEKQLALIAHDSANFSEQDAFYFALTRPEVSVQEFADRTNPYGGAMKDELGNLKWLGCPLRVHRRCTNPMFKICNVTTYQEKMIYGTSSDLKEKIVEDETYASQWRSSTGTTFSKSSHYIYEQGEIAFDIVARFLENNPLEECFIITPFTTIKDGLTKLSKEKGFQEQQVKIGTVHTFQGKEAPLVLFILGVDEQQEGPLMWASKTPNLLNVAVSRAKAYFVIIGHDQTWGKLPFYKVAFEELQKAKQAFDLSHNPIEQKRKPVTQVHSLESTMEFTVDETPIRVRWQYTQKNCLDTVFKQVQNKIVTLYETTLQFHEEHDIQMQLNEVFWELEQNITRIDFISKEPVTKLPKVMQHLIVSNEVPLGEEIRILMEARMQEDAISIFKEGDGWYFKEPETQSPQLIGILANKETNQVELTIKNYTFTLHWQGIVDSRRVLQDGIQLFLIMTQSEAHKQLIQCTDFYLDYVRNSVCIYIKNRC